MNERDLLLRTAELAADYLDSLDSRPVYPQVGVSDLFATLDSPLPDGGSDPALDGG